MSDECDSDPMTGVRLNARGLFWAIQKKHATSLFPVTAALLAAGLISSRDVQLAIYADPDTLPRQEVLARLGGPDCGPPRKDE